MLQAGELAPEITITKTVRSPGSAVWEHENFLHRVTVMVFFPALAETSGAMAALWNRLVDRYDGDEVQFILIVNDGERALTEWLRKNPLDGWLVLDANWETARAWGVEQPQVVFIDAGGKVVGFSPHPLPFDSEIDDVLSGRASKAHLQLRPYSLAGGKPDLPPSCTVHISPTRRPPEQGTASSSGPDHWTALGFELKAVMADVYGIDESRIDFPAALDNGARYDFAVLLPLAESPENMNRLVQQAIERHFRLAVVLEMGPKDVYVLTAPNGIGPSLRDAQFGAGGFMAVGNTWVQSSADGSLPTMADLRNARMSIRDISASGMNITRLCRALEGDLGCFLIDETGLEGSYDFQMIDGGNSVDEFFAALRDQLGLVATPAKREVAMLVVRQE